MYQKYTCVMSGIHSTAEINMRRSSQNDSVVLDEVNDIGAVNHDHSKNIINASPSYALSNRYRRSLTRSMTRKSPVSGLKRSPLKGIKEPNRYLAYRSPEPAVRHAKKKRKISARAQQNDTIIILSDDDSDEGNIDANKLQSVSQRSSTSRQIPCSTKGKTPKKKKKNKSLNQYKPPLTRLKRKRILDNRKSVIIVDDDIEVVWASDDTVNDDQPDNNTKQSSTQSEDQPDNNTEQLSIQSQDQSDNNTEQLLTQIEDQPDHNTEQLLTPIADQPYHNTEQLLSQNEDQPDNNTEQLPTQNEDQPDHNTGQSSTQNEDQPGHNTGQSSTQSEEQPDCNTKQLSTQSEELFCVDTVGNADNLCAVESDPDIIVINDSDSDSKSPTKSPENNNNAPKSVKKKKKKKKRNRYNKVPVKPAEENTKELGNLRQIVVDGCNVAMSHTNGRQFSVKGIELIIDYFQKRGHKVKVFVPLSLPKGTKGRERLEKLYREGIVVFTPSRQIGSRRITPYDDRYILDYALMCGGVVISSDQFRDLYQEDAKWHTTIEKRLLPPTFVDDFVMFPEDPLGIGGPSLNRFLRH